MTAPIRVLIVDDDALVRSGLTMMLSGAPQIEVVGEASDGRGVLPAVDLHHPDVVLMDIRMPRLDGIAATRLLSAQPHPPAVLVLTTFDADELVLRALQAGAAGFLLKDSPPADIVRAIDSVHAGDGTLSPRITRRLINLVAGDPDAATRRRTGTAAAGRADAAGTRGGGRGRRRILQCRDRHAAAHEPGHRQGPRFTAASQARCRQPRPDRPPRARRRSQPSTLICDT